MTDDLDRRTFLRSGAAVTGVGLLAGCGGSGSGGGGDGGDGGDTADGGNTADGSDGSDEESGGGGVPSEVSDYLEGVGNFDGTVVDETGSGNVEVTVGAEGNGGAFAFAPAAVRIDAGTDVNWSWTGEGGQHNVVHEDGGFESQLTDESGNDFQNTFENAGTFLYYCEPHKSLGMKGAVIVE